MDKYLNLYRLFPLPSGRGSRAAIDTQFEMVSSLLREQKIVSAYGNIRITRDGAHIKNLFYTFIWNFCPELIIDGYVYAGVPPLYKVTIGKEYKYIKNDEALEAFKKANPGKKMLVNRMKGYEEVWPLSTFPLICGVI